VLPFRTVNAGADADVWHEGITHLLSSSIESVDGLRKIDPSAVMSAWTASFGEGLDAPDMTEALDVGRQLGARYAIAGSALASSGGGSMRLTAEGYDLETGRSTGSTYVEAPADSVFPLVDRLAVALLRDGVLPADDVQPAGLSQVTTASFEAFRNYLAGEKDFRRGRYEEAATSFVKAAELDTTFARAMYRAGVSYNAIQKFDLGDEFWGRAAALAPILPARDSMLFATNLSALSDRELYTTLYPDDPDGWVQLGESYWHHGGKWLRPTDAYRQAWERALSLVTVYGPEQYVHLIEDAFGLRDSARARALLDAYAGLDPERHPCPQFEHAWADAWGSELDAARVRQELPDEETGGYQCGWTTLAAGSATAIDDWERRDLAVLGTNARDPNGMGLAVVWRTLQARLMRGEIARAREILDRLDGIPDLEEWAGRFVIHWHLTDFPDSTAASAARELLRAQPIVSADPEHFDLWAGSYHSPFWLGVLAVAEGRPVDAEAQAVRLEAAADTIASILWNVTAEDARAMAEAVRHYARLNREWAPDFTGFESTLSRLRSMGFGKEEPEMFLRYWMGRQLLERGDLHRAERYFRSFTPYHWSHFVPAQYHLGRIYEELDETERAREHFRIFIEWWETADPELQPWVEEGRVALARTQRG
jgi:tetratricopeptide (TPR) repeat protein